MSTREAELRQQILDLVAEYHAEAFRPPAFVAGESPVPVAGRVFDAADMGSLIDSSLDFWLTTGRFAAQFEKEFAKYFGVRNATLVNSGSSANLLALTALTSPKLGDRRLQRGDEVITVAAGFPTTVNPIIQNGLVPVFVDVQIPTYNIDVTRLEEALSDRTRVVMIAHTLGNPFDLKAVKEFVDRHHLWLIEDCCDAVGSTFEGSQGGRIVRGSGHREFLSRASHHHGRGRVRAHRKAAAAETCWWNPLPRTGAATAGASRARMTPAGSASTGTWGSCRAGYDHKYVLLAHRIQPEGYRYAGGSGRGAIAQAAGGLHRAAQGQLPHAAAGPSRTWRNSSFCRKPRPAPTRAGSAFRLPSGPARRSRGVSWCRLWNSARSPPGSYSPETCCGSRRTPGLSIAWRVRWRTRIS